MIGPLMAYEVLTAFFLEAGWTLVRTGTRLWATYVTNCSYKTGLEYLGDGKWRMYDYKVPRYQPH